MQLQDTWIPVLSPLILQATEAIPFIQHICICTAAALILGWLPFMGMLSACGHWLVERLEQASRTRGDYSKAHPKVQQWRAHALACPLRVHRALACSRQPQGSSAQEPEVSSQERCSNLEHACKLQSQGFCQICSVKLFLWGARSPRGGRPGRRWFSHFWPL